MASNTRVTQLTAEPGFGGTGNERVTQEGAFPGFNIQAPVRFSQLVAGAGLAYVVVRVTQINAGIAVRIGITPTKSFIIGPID